MHVSMSMQTLGSSMTGLAWLDPPLVFRNDRPFLRLVEAYAAQLHGHRELLSRGIGHRLGSLTKDEFDQVLGPLLDAITPKDEDRDHRQRVVSDLSEIVAGGPTPLILHQKLASQVGERIRMDVDQLAVELFDRGDLAKWESVNEIASGGLLLVAWEAAKPYRTRDPSDPLWQFFRHVRNGAAHNGQLELRHGQPDKPARWRNLEIKAHMHGLRLFVYPPAGGLLSPGDCLYMLSDIEASLMG